MTGIRSNISRGGYLGMVIPLVSNLRAEASLQKLATAMEKRLASIEGCIRSIC